MNPSRTMRLATPALCSLLLTACGSQDEAMSNVRGMPMPSAEADFDDFAKDEAPSRPVSKKAGKRGEAAPSARLAGPGGGGFGAAADIGALADDMAAPEPEEAIADGDGAGGEPAATRSWFPETFLFEPSVVTDADGKAIIEAKVPDRLTRWRVLALAHSREGAQAGTVGSFRSTLPVYVDPIVPPLLAASDDVLVPVQVVNTTDKPVTKKLTITAVGGKVTKASRTVRVPAGGSVTERIPLEVGRPTGGTFRAEVEGADAVERPFVVASVGKPNALERSGSLASEREIPISLPKAIEAGSVSARLSITPGALALVRSELAAAPSRDGAAAGAYLLMLAGRAKALTTALGGEVDDKQLRRLRLLSTQRALRFARRPSPETAALFAPGALTHDDPLLKRMGERLAGQVADAQRPDGTFFGQPGWPLQRVIVATAAGLRVQLAHEAASDKPVHAATRARLKASVAFARFLPQVKDAYTAAAVVSTGVDLGDDKAKLLETIRKQVSKASDGTRFLAVPSDVERPFGGRPSQIEATALAVLALKDDPEAKALLPDLGAHLLAAYRPWRGFGDAHTNLLALDAVRAVFAAPLPARIVVTLTDGERALATETLEGERLTRRVTFTTPLTDARQHSLKLKADPPVPGLGYHLQVGWTEPWPEGEERRGLDLIEERGKTARVGRPVPVTLRAAAPGGLPLEIEHRLPAGVAPDKTSLQALVDDNTIQSFETEDGLVSMKVPRRRQGQPFVATYRVIPTLAGTMHMGPSIVRLQQGGAEQMVPLPAWKVLP
jgi:hypothetical protein